MSTENTEKSLRLRACARRAESDLTALFAHAAALPEPRRAVALAYVWSFITKAAGTGAPSAAPAAPSSATRRSPEPRLVVTGPANDGSKGPKCDRCGGAGQWKGSKGGSGPCFTCNGSGVQRARRRAS